MSSKNLSSALNPLHRGRCARSRCERGINRRHEVDTQLHQVNSSKFAGGQPSESRVFVAQAADIRWTLIYRTVAILYLHDKGVPDPIRSSEPTLRCLLQRYNYYAQMTHCGSTMVIIGSCEYSPGKCNDEGHYAPTILLKPKRHRKGGGISHDTLQITPLFRLGRNFLSWRLNETRIKHDKGSQQAPVTIEGESSEGGY